MFLIYDPDEFRKFCISAGAPSIFDNVLASVTTPRKSTKRIEKLKKVTVNVIYPLCFAVNQFNNGMQKNHSVYLMLKNLNKEALDTEHCLRSSCRSRTAYYMRESTDQLHEQNFNKEIDNAIKGGYLVVCIIDDFHCIHSLRRPTDEKTSQEKHVCTMVIKTFPQIPAIPLPSNMEDLHNTNGISEDICVSVICCPGSMHTLSMSSGTTMPAWIKAEFFYPKNERRRLHIHDYI